MLVELAQYVESNTEGDIVKQYTTSDLGQAFIKVSSTDLLRDMGVYLYNSGEQQRKKDLIEQLILKHNQSLMPFSKLMEIIRMDNLADVQKSLEHQEAIAQKQAQAAEQAKLEHEQQILQAQLEDKQKDRDLKKYEIDTKANIELQKVTLQGIANESSFDPNVDLTDKLIAQKEIALKENDAISKNYIAQQQLTNQLIDSFNKNRLEKEKLTHARQLKEKEFKDKKGIENEKLKQITAQNKNQELMQSKKIEADLKLQRQKAEADLTLKDKDLKLKELDLKIRKLEIENAAKKASIEIKSLEKKIELEEDMADVKASSIEKLTKVKEKEAIKLTEIKSKEAEQASKLKMEQNEQQHSLKLKENVESHKQKLKEIKIKPKLNKKK